MFAAGLQRTRDAALRACALASSAITVGGRYHELNAVADLCMAAAFAIGPRRDAGAPSAIERWDAAVRAAPDLPVCHYRLAGELRKTGAFDRARAVIADAVARFPNDLGTALEAASLAQLCGDYADACAHWHRVTRMAKARPGWLAGAAHSLICVGRVDEAETLLAEARAAHPKDVPLLAAECMLAGRKRDWSKTLSLSREIRRRFPKQKDLLGELVYAETLSKIDEIANEPSITPSAQVKLGAVKDEEIRQLLLRFESLGDNCEFGLVQRRFGAEPLGLFRWNRVDAGDLIAALDHRLEGIGEPEHTELILTEPGEFYVLDRRWFLGMHTFLFAHQTTHDELYDAILRRTAALKARFVEELTSGAKTFVFLSSGLDRATLLDLHRALGVFAPVRLLAVQPASAAAPAAFSGRPGDVVMVEPGCFVGFLRRRGIAADGTWQIAFDDWVSICRKTEAMADRDVSAVPRVPIA